MVYTNLSVSPTFHHRHDEVFSSHEGQLLSDSFFNHFGVDNEPLGDILQCAQYYISSEKCFSQVHPPTKSSHNQGLRLNKPFSLPNTHFLSDAGAPR